MTTMALYAAVTTTARIRAVSLHVDLTEAEEVADRQHPAPGTVWQVAGYYDEREDIGDGQIVVEDPDTGETLILSPLEAT
jgi:hypothetical protein